LGDACRGIRGKRNPLKNIIGGQGDKTLPQTINDGRRLVDDRTMEMNKRETSLENWATEFSLFPTMTLRAASPD